MNLSGSANSRFFIGFLISSLLFGSASFAVNAVNTPESGYVLCVNKKTQAVTFPGTDKCPKGSTQLLLGAQGIPGVKGDKGDIGLAGINGAAGAQGLTGTPGAVGLAGAVGATGPTGARGSSLLTGVGTPSNQLGDEGDTYIDKNAAQIYGPKKSGIWGYGIGFAGPAGAQGPVGARGPSNSYFDYSDVDLEHSGSGPELCFTSDFRLPAGSYIVTAYVEAFDDARLGQTQMNATISVGDSRSEPLIGTIVPDSGYGSLTIPWAFESVPNNSSVKIYCDSSGGIVFRTIIVTAISTNTLTKSP
jgi:hypothetical protein